MGGRAHLTAWVAMALLALPVQAPPPLPSYLKLPPNGSIVENYSQYEAYGEIEFRLSASTDGVKRGRHYSVRLKLDGLPEEPTHEQLRAPLRAAFKSAGWTQTLETDTNPPFMTFHYQKGDVDAWAGLSLFAPDQITTDIIEVAANPMTVTFPAPAPQPETIADDQPFPYIGPLPGSTMNRTDPDFGPLRLVLNKDEEPTLISEKSIEKQYTEIPGLSTLQFADTYEAALKRAGWTIIQRSQGLTQSDAVLVAHYDKNGRNIWTYMHGGGPTSVVVADVGAVPLALDKACHLPLYGVLFDFNKATLKRESDAVLTKALGALQANASMSVEVQGHTDNVGGADPNLKLSQARADAVKAWFVAHGVPAARLTSKGYGLSQPVDSNDSPEGRAKNRRVELAKPGCQ